MKTVLHILLGHDVFSPVFMIIAGASSASIVLEVAGTHVEHSSSQKTRQGHTMANGAPVNSSGSGDDTLAMVILIALMCFLIWALGGHVIRGVLLLMR